VAKYKSMEDVVGYTAALSQIRPGKVLLGLVPGGNIERMSMSKAPVDMMKEAFLSASYLLQKKETGFVGKYFNISPGFKMNYNSFGPFPLLLGAWGEKMSFLAGQVADIIEVGASANPKIIPIIKNRIRLGAESVNRNPNDISIIMGGFTFIDDDISGAYKAVKKVIPYVISSAIKNDPSLTEDFPEQIKTITNLLSLNKYDEISTHIPNELAKRFAFIGTPNDIIEQAQEIFDSGATGIEFGTPHNLSNNNFGVSLLVDKVFKYFKDKN
jgi:5,10-methylenetetrahydromethanopterin reductase